MDAEGEKKLGWFNSTELSVVLISGNSSSQTYGFKDTLRWVGNKDRFRVKADYVRADTADDWFLLVAPGITFEPGERPTDAPTTLVKPPIEPDVEKMFVEGVYGREVTKRVFWSVGGSWDRNEDAGILSRFIGFGTIGNRWWDRDDLRFSTGYGLSYTDRREEEPDPEKDDRFAGFRFDADVHMKIGTVTSFDHDTTANFSFSDGSDYTLDISNSLTVKMSKRLSLKASLQWLFNHKPALDDFDVVARVVLEDPNGIPGDGDEFFRTVSSGGIEVELGEARARKEQLDTVFRTALVIDF